MKARLLLLMLAGLIGVGGGWMFTRLVLQDNPAPPQHTSPPSPRELVGQRRPDFTLGGTTGELFSAADFDGSVVLLNFWATWCAPCRAEMPMLEEIYGEYSSQGVEIVGIAFDEVRAASEFAGELGITYPVLVGTGDVMAVGMAYGNRAGLLPYSVLIDRQGVVRQTWLGELDRSDLREHLEALL